MYGAGMGDGDRHTPLDLPVVLAGGARGQLTGGRHLRYEENTPFMNLLRHPARQSRRDRRRAWATAPAA